MRAEARVKYWGASVYSIEEARRAAACSDIALIQAPCNVWDQRLRRSGALAEAKERGKLVFVRSLYLQGLLVMTPEAVAEKLPCAGAAARRWRDLAQDLGVRPAELAVRFGMALDAPLVVGAESAGQVAETAAFARKGPLPEAMIDAIHAAMAPHLTEETVNPSLWGI
jgi:aryl-alcohol dehydrogenase-like predicted oxidoreductase